MNISLDAYGLQHPPVPERMTDRRLGSFGNFSQNLMAGEIEMQVSQGYKSKLGGNSCARR